MQQVSVRDSRDIQGDRRWIDGVYYDYLNDLAPTATGIFPALGEIGHRVPDQMARWYADPNAHVLTVLYGEERAGFAMVNQRPRSPAPARAADSAAAPAAVAAAPAAAAAPGASGAIARASEFSMGDFFIARPWRRRGIGAQAVRLILERFTGQWLITEHLRNSDAVKFWRRVVTAYTDGRFQERIVNGEVHQRFESGSRRPPR